MAGNSDGAKKAALKIKSKDPDFYKRIGKLGGQSGNTGGFFTNRELARKVGAIGGKKSRRGKAAI